MNPISGMTYYDSLNKLVTGILVLLPLVPSPAGELWSNPLFYIAAFIVGIVYQSIVQCVTKCLRNNECLIKKAYIIITGSKKFTIKGYYYDYYYVAKNQVLINIPVLEATENFLRNIFFILLFYLIALLTECTKIGCLLSFLGSECHVAIGLAIILFFIVFIWLKVQLNIHCLIVEGGHYLKQIQQNEKSNTLPAAAPDGNSEP